MENEKNEISSIVQCWKTICAQRQYALGNKMETATFIGALGEAFALTKGSTNVEQEKEFIDEILQETTVVSILEGVPSKEFIEICIKAGIYKIAFLHSMQSIYEDPHMTEERKKEKYCKEYIFQNSEALYALEKMMGLCFILKEPLETVVETIEMYVEELEDTYDCWADEDEDREE